MPTAVDTAAVQTTALAGTVPAHSLSIFGMFLQADFLVKGVILLLFTASIICWAIIIDKWRTFRKVRNQTEKFEKVFWSGRLLDEIYDKVRDFNDHPIAAVFVAAMQEWKRKGTTEELVSKDYTLRTGLKERIFQAMQVARNRGVEGMEKHLSFLATVGSAAPFIGLFGTVWGIMNSFQSIALSKNTTLAVVAPGIAEALFATAVGLFAAIPAMMFYNIYSSNLNRIVNKIDDFSSELDALLSRGIGWGQ